MKYCITLLLIIMAFVCGMNWADREPVVERYPTVCEFQEFLGIEADGKVGPEFKRVYEAWSQEIEFNGYGIESMFRAGDMPE